MTDATTGPRPPALIWAQARNGVIGHEGGLPWHVPEDAAHFRELTSGAVVLMGRRTWDSLPARFRPLPGRRNLVLTRRGDWSANGAERVAGLEEGLAAAGDRPVWVIGGGELYRAAIGLADRLEVTEFDVDVDGDTHAPEIVGAWKAQEGPWLVSLTGVRYRFVGYRRRTDRDTTREAG